MKAKEKHESDKMVRKGRFVIVDFPLGYWLEDGEEPKETSEEEEPKTDTKESCQK